MESDREGKNKDEAPTRLLLEPRSLLVLGEGIYQNWLHEIEDVTVDENLEPFGCGEGLANWDLLDAETRGMLTQNGGRWARRTRVSVTLRDVWKTRDLGRLVPGLRKAG